MTPTALDRVFGRSRLRMVTGPYVEVYREAAPPGERRRYTKRFINTQDGDFREWTEREWRILARLVGHGARHVPDVVQYDRGAGGGDALVQTYDAGVTVDHWATLLPVQRGGRVQRHIFQDCAHWWSLARHLLLALHEIHALKLVHLDLKADNICLPFAPPGFHPAAAQPGESALIYPVFEDVALIDFAFSLISGEALTSPLPIGWQRKFPYQSPRLLAALEAGHKGDLEPTRRLDWRCDMFSLAALLTCFLPGAQEMPAAAERGWTAALHAEARLLLRKIRNTHEVDAGSRLPHLALAAACAKQLQLPALAKSLTSGWSLASDAGEVDALAPTAPLTPVTLIEPHPEAAAATEIFVRRGVAGEAWAGAPTLPAGPPRAGQAALATEPAVHGVLPWAPVGPVAISVAESAAAGAAQTSAGPAAEVDVETPAGAEAIEQPIVAWPATAAPEQALVVPSDRRWRRDAAWRVGLPLAGLLAGSVWLFTGLGESGRHEASNAPDGSTRAAADPGPRAQPAPETVAAVASRVKEEAAPVRQAPAVTSPDRPVPVAVTRDEPRAVASAARPAAPMTVAVESNVDRPVAAPAGPAELRLPQDGYARRAGEIVAQVLPVVVERASPRIGEVLSAAAQAQNPADDLRTRAAAESVGDAAFTEAELRRTSASSSAQARQFNAAAQKAFWQGGDVARAFELQWQAFGAHPQDPEIAGNLAFYAMNLNPRQVEMARGLAIYALAAATRSTGPSRLEDWGSLAVANALSGRTNDSANAMLVLLSVSKDVNRSCRSALSSVATFGPALKEPAQALLSRAHARGAANTPYCGLPPKWSLGSKLP